jgi:hypothetical protein
LYASKNVIKVIKSWMKWVGHEEGMGEMRSTYKIFIGKTERDGGL